jgi:hypothetical protein
VLSDEPASGKTRVLELVSLLSHDATIETDPTGPALVSLINTRHPTILLDETDQIWGRAGGDSNRQLKSILNSGYRQGATVTRRSGHAYRQDSIYAAVGFAGLGILPGTLLSRSVVIRMAQRRSEQVVENFAPRMHAPLGLATGEALGSWAKSVTLDLATAWPEAPDRVTDRSAEIWEPLLAVADLAGGEWPDRARAACLELVLGQESEPVISPAQRILADLRVIWGRDGNLPSATVCRRLLSLPGAPWASLWSEASAARELAALLSVHGIKVCKIRLDAGKTAQGYKRSDVEARWPQVPALPPADSDVPGIPEVPPVPDSAATVPARAAR